MEQKEIKKNIYDFGSVYNSVPSIDIDLLSLCDSELTEEQIAMNSVSWILQFKEFYRTNSPKGREAFEILEQSLADESKPEDYFDALNNFAENFMNNPYMYESGLYFVKDAEKIKAENSACYLVKFREVIVPLGLLRHITSEECAVVLMNNFFSEKNSEFNVILNKNIEACDNYMLGHEEDISYSKKLKRRRRLRILIIIFSALFALDKLIFGVDWFKIPAVIKSGVGFIPSVGLLTEKSYGISHNSVFCIVLLLIAIIWFIVFISMIRPKSIENRHLKLFKRNAEGLKKCADVSSKLKKFKEENESRRLFVIDNVDNLDNIEMECTSRLISYDIKRINEIGELSKVIPRRMRYKKSGKLLLVFLLLCFSFHISNSTNIIKSSEIANEAYCSVSKLIDNIKFKMVKKYCVNETTPVYAKPDSESFIVYEMQEGETFEIVNYDYSENYIYGVRIFTRYGFINGWLSGADFAYYTPDVPKINPQSAQASSEGKISVAKRAIDSLSYTAWCENVEGQGIGEYIDVNLENATPIDVVMIQIGNGFSNRTYANNSRPYILSVEYFKDEKLLTNAYVVLSDVQRVQYYCLNKSVEADKVRFVIDTVIEGEKYDDTYISELELFYTEKPQE